MLPLAHAGPYHIVAPDQRGFGRTTGWDSRPYGEVDLHTCSRTSLVRDVLVLARALGYATVKCVVGHGDVGGMVAADCALIRPDIFQSVLLINYPFAGVPDLPRSSSSNSSNGKKKAMHDRLAALGRKHYQQYYSSARANADMAGPITARGLRGFFRGYFYLKSGGWAGNDSARALETCSADEFADKLPYYYVMPVQASMPEAVQMLMKSEEPDSSKQWLSDEELEVYVSEYARTGFQGGLNWYRVVTASGCDSGSMELVHELDIFSGLKIKVPCAFLGGKKDWGLYQEPGAMQKMGDGTACEELVFLRMIDGAGHWIQQEKPDEVTQGILELLKSVR
jgi:microsomal epoxide hydrolase